MTAPSSSPSLRVGAGAHRGKVRDENQDRISRFRSPFGEVFVVADGVGGSQGGAQAAEMVIDGLEAHLAALPPDTPPAEALQTAAQSTSAAIYERARSGDPATAQMGATGVVALLSGPQARVGHAGDCRAYLLRGGELARLTRDHSRVQQMLERNLLSEDEAREHPDANVVTRAFGKEPDLDLEVSAPFELRDGDLLLLASDGLCGYVDDAAIRAALLAGGDAQEVADRLITLALDAGGEDNVSVQVIVSDAAAVRAPAPLPAASAAPAATAAGGRAPLSWASIAALLALAFLAGFLLERGMDAGKKLWRGDGKPAAREGASPVKPDAAEERRRKARPRTQPETVPEPSPRTGAAPEQPSIRIEIRRRKPEERLPQTEIEIPSVDSTEAPEPGPVREVS